MNRKPMSKGLKVFIGLTVFGMIASWYVILTTTTGALPRPDLLLEEELSKYAEPTSAMISRNRNVIFDRQAETTYQLGRIEEVWIAIAVCQLHDQGKVNLDTSVGDYVPRLGAGVAAVPLKAWLSHTSGLPEGAESLPTHNEPLPHGQQSVYAPANYQLMRGLVEEVSGSTFPEYATREIVERIELKNTRWDEETQDWISTPNDLHTFLTELNSNRLIRMKTHLKAFTPPLLEGGSRGHFAFGWQVDNYGGLRLERFTSNHKNNTITLIRYPEKAFVALICNGSDAPPDTDGLAELIGDLYLEREMPFPLKR